MRSSKSFIATLVFIACARSFQIENQPNSAIDLRVAASLPFIQ
jgi:hypothetical protein